MKAFLTNVLLTLAMVFGMLTVLGAVMAAHEAGHLLVCKATGVGVYKFKVFLGAELFSFDIGETRYALGGAPFGAVVIVAGEGLLTDEGLAQLKESNPAAASMMLDPDRWESSYGFWVRFLILLAGPLANFLFAVVVLFMFVLVRGRPISSASLQIEKITSGSSAEAAGLMAGDQLLSVGGVRLSTWHQALELLEAHRTGDLTMTVQREDAQLELHLSVDSTGETPVESFDAAPHGIVPDFYSGLSYRKFPAKRRIVKSLKFAGSFILKLIVELVSVLGRLVIRRRETRKLGGGVVSIFSEGMGAVLGGSFKVVIFAISVSIGWGLINLVVPIPMLDGGQIVLLTYETLVAPVTPVVKSWLMAISIWIILTLFIIGLWKDVVNLVRMLKNRK